ncbi:MAG: hypothetical protein ACYTBJ_14730 [Planctomycetota bacterium]|jgi:hypothetical protein
MPFVSPLTGPQVTKIRAGNFNSSAFVLVNPVNIVFSAQVNQAVFGATFAQIDFDNIVTGAITDVLDGYVVYISDSSEDVFNSQFRLRARGDGVAGTTIDVNETSFNIQDDQYITVVKDVAGREKLGRYVNKTMFVDWDITFRQLLPLVTNLQGAYGQKLSGGSATFTFPAVGFATTQGATISSWLWDADGGSFVNGTSSTDAQPDIQYTVAGVYWPRVTVTDSGGRSNWFTMTVFVMSADMSDSFIITGVENLSIKSRIGVGDELTFSAFSEEFTSIPTRSFVAVWEEPSYDGDTTPIVDNVLYVGRLRKETPRAQVQGVDGPQPDTNYICEDYLAQMNRIRSPQLALSLDDTPTEFQQIAKMTQWRIVVFVLSEFSTFLNLCSLRFDDETNNYLNLQDSTEDKSLLASVNGILAARKTALNIARQGELYAAQGAVFQSTTDRNALDTIHSFTTADLFRYSTTNDKTPTVGNVDVFGGGYSSADSSLRVIRAVAPAVASLEAQGGTKPINGILLATDGTAAEQGSELEELSGNELANANPKDKPNLDVLDGYYFMSPTNFQWWKLILSTADNNRGIEYTSNDRFLLSSVNITYDNQLNTWNVTPVITAETVGVGAKTISQVQPGAIEPTLPPLPSIPAYPAFPANDEIYLPTGWNDFNIPSIGQNDAVIIIAPLPPGVQVDAQTEKGSVVAYWDTDTKQLYMTTEFTETDAPEWLPKFTAEAPFSIIDFKFDPHNKGAYLLTTDGSNNTEFYRTDDIFVQIPVWELQLTTLDDIEYTSIRTTATPGEVYIFGIDDRVPPSTISLLNTNGQGDLLPSSLISPHANSSNAPGVYTEGSFNYFLDGGIGDNGGKACNIEIALPARAILKQLRYIAQASRDASTTLGEDECQVSLDGVAIGGLNEFPAGTYPFPASPTTGTGTLDITKGTGLSLSLEGNILLFHAAMEKESAGTGCRITQITLWLQDSGKDMTAFRRSENSGSLWGSLKTSGEVVSASATPGFDTGKVDTSAYLPADDVLRGTDDFGVSFGNKAGSSTTGTYAKSVWSYGKTATVDTLIGTAALFDTTKTLISTVNGSQVDITPDDGIDEGIVLNKDALCMSRVSDTHIWGVFDFGGTPKLAYTDDFAATSWTISGESLLPSATYIRVKETNTNQVYLINSTVIKYSSEGGANFRDKSTLSTNIKGVEVR